MELRSTRSRSRTPFGHTYLSEEVEEYDESGGNHVEKSVSKVTKRTTTTTIKTSDKNNTTSSSDEYYTTSYNTNSDAISNVKSTRSKSKLGSTNQQSRRGTKIVGFKTSDYSSDEGENEVSTKRVISQNDRNQLIEDAKAAVNGNSGESIALRLYRRAGRYWDKYPKTDWTYSPHSQDRVELTPGTVQMPNMSRRSIHSAYNSVDYDDKQTNTEVDYVSRKSYNDTNRIRTRLFSNNNYTSKTQVTRSWSQTVTTSITRVFISIYTLILTTFYTVLSPTYSWGSWFGSKIHRFVSRVMLLDNWLLKKSQPRNKRNTLVLLCLLPLLLFLGWCLLAGLGNTLYATLFNRTESIAEENLRYIPTNDYSSLNKQPGIISVVSEKQPIIEEKIVKITEKIYVEPPKAHEIAAGLTKEQLELVAASITNYINVNDKINTDEIIEKILLTPSIQNIINNYNINNNNNNNRESESSYDEELLNRQQSIINNLRDEINKIRKEMLNLEQTKNKEINNILSKIESETLKTNVNIKNLKSCCDKNIIDYESYVTKILTDLLNNPEFLNNQEGLSDWLHTMFVAKKDLEKRIANLTVNLHERFDSLVQNNGKVLMDEVAGRIKMEVHKNARNTEEKTTQQVDVDLNSLSEARIKKIIASTLAVYDADKTGLVDYAMESMGGQIITTRCTEPYVAGSAEISLFGIPLWYPSNKPRTVITPSIKPGECWAFQNFPGLLVVKLAGPIRIEAFSYEHVSKLLVPDGKTDSAPRQFEVYGLHGEDDKHAVLLGSYTYEINEDELQFFPVAKVGQVYSMIELRVLNNHGNPNYTCLYRFRVHGKLSDSPS